MRERADVRDATWAAKMTERRHGLTEGRQVSTAVGSGRAGAGQCDFRCDLLFSFSIRLVSISKLLFSFILGLFLVLVFQVIFSFDLVLVLKYFFSFQLSFLPRDAMHPRYKPWPCVCLSVCPSQVGVLLKRLNGGSRKQHHTIVHGL